MAMRSTLTIDPDVAALLKQLLKERGTSFKQIVNEALRRGISQLKKGPQTRKPFKVKPFNTRLLIDVSSTSRALEIAEGENCK